MPTPAREVAFDILLRVEQRQAYASELLHSPRLDRLSSEDRHLCTELVMGTLRWRSRLDFGISAVSTQSIPKLDSEVLTCLRLSAYQIGFLRVPARAAVNESVELIKRAHKRYSAPFVNAVLRKLALTPELMQSVLPPGPKTVIDLAQLYAHPLWLVERWAAQYGMETAEKICDYDQRVPAFAVCLRDKKTADDLRRDGVELDPGALLASSYVVAGGTITQTRAFAEGRVMVQDEASQLIALLVGTGDRVLDCCAAPGGKTAILAERNPGSLILATDRHPHRAALMRQRLDTMANVHVVAGNAAALPVAAEFDRVLADVPCSGTGTLARNPEIKWRLTSDVFPSLHALQVSILQSALQRLGRGGRLVYSTCSLEHEENASVVEGCIAGDFRVVHCRDELMRLHDAGDLVWTDIDSLLRGPYLRTLPGMHPCGGFFAALIERRS